MVEAGYSVGAVVLGGGVAVVLLEFLKKLRNGFHRALFGLGGELMLSGRLFLLNNLMGPEAHFIVASE
ncbi:hypothetical protein CCP2SC5_130017 [Azospirillaceae bacterium]